jgi:hypothetical protein
MFHAVLRRRGWQKTSREEKAVSPTRYDGGAFDFARNIVSNIQDFARGHQDQERSPGTRLPSIFAKLISVRFKRVLVHFGIAFPVDVRRISIDARISRLSPGCSQIACNKDLSMTAVGLFMQRL